MCGIAGIAHVDGAWPVDPAELRRMCDILRHRGPDDDGYWTGDGVGLGMRRLSSIDVAGGHKPLANEDVSVWFIQNGEIYNFAEVRAQLERAGHQFATRSDTEVIAHAYEEWGDDCVARLVGMFGIALWDRKRRRLLLARDRLGEKPLFYASDGRQIAFASEMKALTQVPGVPRRLNLAALDDYLALGYTPGPATIFHDVWQLPPAHLLAWEAGRVTVRPYWRLSFEPTSTDDEATAVAPTRVLRPEAGGARLMSEVPLGAFLSGGVDSSTVVGFMAGLSDIPVKTFSIGFEEDDYSEVGFAREVARHFHTEHHEFVVRPNLIDVLPDLVWMCDQPFADSSVLPTYYVAKLAREYVTVALSGDGGDELFGGYARYGRALRRASDGRLPAPVRDAASHVSALMPDGMKGKVRLRALALSPESRYVDASSCIAASRKPAAFTPQVWQALCDHDSYGVPLSFFASGASLDFAKRMQYVDTNVYLPDDILTKVDRASMAVSLETRAPLLDPALAEYVASLPASYHIKNGRLKHLLKEVAADFLPGGIVNRPKKGFAVPLKHWFRDDLSAFAREVLTSQTFNDRQIFEPRFARKLIEHHNAGHADNSARIWALLCFELWARQYLDPPTPTRLSQREVTLSADEVLR